MFTINLEDGRGAPSKARKKSAKRLEFLVISNIDKFRLGFLFFSEWLVIQERTLVYLIWLKKVNNDEKYFAKIPFKSRARKMVLCSLEILISGAQ